MIQQTNFEIFTQPTPQVHNNSTGTIALHNVLHIFSTHVQTKATAKGQCCRQMRLKDNISSGDFLVDRLARGMSTGKCCGPKIDNWPLQSALICRCLAVIACGGRGTTFVGGAFLDPVLVNWDKGDL